LADAILDRLTANAHRFDLKGDSLRQRNKQTPKTGDQKSTGNGSPK